MLTALYAVWFGGSGNCETRESHSAIKVVTDINFDAMAERHRVRPSLEAVEMH